MSFRLTDPIDGVCKHTLSIRKKTQGLETHTVETQGLETQENPGVSGLDVWTPNTCDHGSLFHTVYRSSTVYPIDFQTVRPSEVELITETVDVQHMEPVRLVRKTRSLKSSRAIPKILRRLEIYCLTSILRIMLGT